MIQSLKLRLKNGSQMAATFWSRQKAFHIDYLNGFWTTSIDDKAKLMNF